MAGTGGPHQVLVNNVLAAINAATARAQGEEAAALQRAEEREEAASQAQTPVEVCVRQRGNRGGQAACRGRGAHAPGTPHPHHETRPLQLLDEFWLNIPLRFVPINVWHNGVEVPAKYITVHMANDLYVLGTMGAGQPIFRGPAHAAPRLTQQEAHNRGFQNIRLLCTDYIGKEWVDEALVRLHDDGLKAEVHRFRQIHEEVKWKEEEVRRLEDRLGDLQLEAVACTQRLLRAEAIKRVKDQRGEPVQLISPWTFERGHSA